MENDIDKLMNVAEKNNVADKFTDTLAKSYILRRDDIIGNDQNMLQQEVLETDDKATEKTLDELDELKELPFKWVKSTKYGYQSLNHQDIKDLKHKLQSLIKNKDTKHQKQSTELQEPQSTGHPMGDLEEMHYVHEHTLAKLGEDRYEDLLMKENPLPTDNLKDDLPF